MSDYSLNDRDKQRNAELDAARQTHVRLIEKHFPPDHPVYELEMIHRGIEMANFFFGPCPEPDKSEYICAHYVRIF
jgi:hypothetical protein